VITSEPGDTPAGKELRRILLDRTTLSLSGRTEVLLFAADRAPAYSRGHSAGNAKG